MRTASFLFLSASWVFAQPKPPTLLVEALRQLPGVHVLEASMVRLPVTVDDLKSGGNWPPWASADLDRDRLPDVVAAVVKPTRGGTQYGVVAIHARTPTRIYWVVRLDTWPINSVAVGGFQGPDAVTPLYCYFCDGNPWFRWSGRSYEPKFYAIGDRIQIDVEENSKTTNLYVQPSRDARKPIPVQECTNAKVLSFRGTSYETRWYFVELLLSKPVRGWIPAETARVKGDCYVDGQ